jgi:hypothetical protein
MLMDEPSSNPQLLALHAFRKALEGESAPAISTLVELKEQGFLEQALLELKRKRPRMNREDPWQAWRTRLELEITKARDHRIHQWQLDPNRRSLRFRMEVLAPACTLHPSALQAVLARALLESGLPLAMGLEKTPRPMVRLGHPLPLGVVGLAEWADAILREPPAVSMEDLSGCINDHCPDGLRILEAEEIPNHASPVLDLCAKGHWAWACAPEMRASAGERLRRFEAMGSYEIAKIGKVEGQKRVKLIEVRQLVLRMGWEGESFHFTTRLSASEAMNPIKLLAGILEREPAAILGLTRLRVELAEDPRLVSADKYETKLHNIFEDAVLLESGPTIQCVEEEEDDEPIVLRRDLRKS